MRHRFRYRCDGGSRPHNTNRMRRGECGLGCVGTTVDTIASRCDYDAGKQAKLASCELKSCAVLNVCIGALRCEVVWAIRR